MYPVERHFACILTADNLFKTSKPATMYKVKVLLLLPAICAMVSLSAQQVISDMRQPGSLEIASANYTATICYDASDLDLARLSASWMQQDVEMVTGKKLRVMNSLPSQEKTIVVIGTIEHS